MRKLASLFLVSSASLACLEARAADLTAATALNLESRYVFRGVQYADTSLQPSLTLSMNGFHLGAWANLPVGDANSFGPAKGEELDLVAGYSMPLTDKITVDLGLTFYVFPEAMNGFGDFYEEDGDGSGANTLEPYIAVSFDAPLSPVITLYRDFMFDTTTLQGAASRSLSLGGRSTFDLAGMIGYVFDDRLGEDYLYGVASAGVGVKTSQTSKLFAGLRYGGSNLAGGSLVSDDNATTARPSGFWWGIGLSAEF